MDASVKIGHKIVVKLYKLLLLPTKGTECFAGMSIRLSVRQFGPGFGLFLSISGLLEDDLDPDVGSNSRVC